MSYDKTTLV